jgi:signal transduction histidine kinase
VQIFGEVLSSALARNRAELGERDARAEAAHAARLGTMGVVAASLAHELTQPLAAIMTNAETAMLLASSDTIDREELRATIEDILGDDRRAGTLIHQLRRFLRRDDVDRGTLDLRALLAEVPALVRGEAVGRGVTLAVDATDGLPTVTGNHAQILQVLLNLVLNAFDAVARNPMGPGNVRLTAFAADRCAVIEVADDGAGMDEAAQARAFTPFYTTKPKGMGLGLSISRSIAESHGGSLSVQSAPGEGSVFRLELPQQASP